MGALCCNSDGMGHTPETVTTTKRQMPRKILPLFIVKYEMKVAKQSVELKSTNKLSLDEIYSG